MIRLRYISERIENINDFLVSKGFSSNNIYELIKNKNVTINAKEVLDKNQMVDVNSIVQVYLLDEESDIPLNNKEIDVVYEDDYFMVVYKPANLDIEPTIKNYEDTLANRIAYYFNQHNIKSKVHLVNRLDKLTQGFVIVAKNRYIHNLFTKINIKKYYVAIVEGFPGFFGRKIVYMKKQEGSMKRVLSNKIEGKKCITDYRLINYHDGKSKIAIKLITGRTHQIRFTFASLGHPLVGDTLYNSDRKIDGDFTLIANKLIFNHPILNYQIKIKM